VGLEPRLDDNGGVGKGVDAENFDGSNMSRPVFEVLFQLGGNTAS